MPSGRPTYEVVLESRVLLPEVMAEEHPEQLVVPEPVRPRLDPRDEHRCAMELLEHRQAARMARDEVAERSAHSVQHGSRQDEAADVIGLAIEHLLREVVGDVA